MRLGLFFCVCEDFLSPRLFAGVEGQSGDVKIGGRATKGKEEPENGKRTFVVWFFR